MARVGVRATRPMSSQDWTRWEISQARQLLDASVEKLDVSEALSIRHEQGLRGALTHAIRAWCRTHLRCKDARSDDHSYSEAFHEKASADMVQAVTRARAAIDWHRLETRQVSTAEVVLSVRVAVGMLLEAASSPPRSRRRFPAHLRAFRPPRRPRVKPGSWVDTGRYRPALVLEAMPEPPHTMKLSYGDEIDEDFRPHIADWMSVRRPRRVASLKDVFSTGDWFRHPRCGYGRVLAVRDSTMDVEYNGRRATVVPDAALRQFKRVEGLPPEAPRPLAERFPPGTWIEQDHYGRGIVLGSG